MRRVGAIGAAIAVAAGIAFALAWSAVASASPFVHAHRGGPLDDRARRAAAGLSRELAARVPRMRAKARLRARDGHPGDGRRSGGDHARRLAEADDELRPASSSERTLAEIRSDCEIDILGTDELSRHLGRRDDRRAKVPTVIQALELAARKGVGVNLEINNYPTDPDFDPGSPPRFAIRVAAQVKQSGFPPDDLILQSFLPGNLKAFQDDPYFDDSETSFLTFRNVNGIAAAVADASGIDWISPQWPVSSELIAERSRAGPARGPVHVRLTRAGPQRRRWRAPTR